MSYRTICSERDCPYDGFACDGVRGVVFESLLVWNWNWWNREIVPNQSKSSQIHISSPHFISAIASECYVDTEVLNASHNSSQFQRQQLPISTGTMSKRRGSMGLRMTWTMSSIQSSFAEFYSTQRALLSVKICQMLSNLKRAWNNYGFDRLSLLLSATIAQ